MVKAKSRENRDEERKPDGHTPGDCRRWEKGAELNIGFLSW
jgi:hypothetical protein